MVTKKTLIILAVVMLLGVYPVRADLVFSSGYNTYDDSYGYNFEVWVINDAVLDVLGGEMKSLRSIDLATANVYNGDIEWLETWDNGVINIYGGNMIWLGAWDSGLINLYAYDVTYHPTGGGTWGDKEWIEGTFYSGNNVFSLWLYNDEAYSHVNIVPEPAILLMLSLGSLLVRKRK
jgi:hypothetical protein